MLKKTVFGFTVFFCVLSVVCGKSASLQSVSLKDVGLDFSGSVAHTANGSLTSLSFVREENVFVNLDVMRNGLSVELSAGAVQSRSVFNFNGFAAAGDYNAVYLSAGLVYGIENFLNVGFDTGFEVVFPQLYSSVVYGALRLGMKAELKWKEGSPSLCFFLKGLLGSQVRSVEFGCGLRGRFK